MLAMTLSIVRAGAKRVENQIGARLAEFRPAWVEEPTSPDDILGHAAVRRAVSPIKVATGEPGRWPTRGGK